MTINFKITNVTCGACVKLGQAALENLSGVKKIEIKNNGLAIIESDREIAWEEIKNVLNEVNLNVSLI